MANVGGDADSEVSADFSLTVSKTSVISHLLRQSQIEVQKARDLNRNVKQLVSPSPSRAKKRSLEVQNNKTANCKKMKLLVHSKKFSILSGVKSLGQQLGCGHFGRVYAVKYADMTCAAKEIHRFESVKPEKKQELKQKFEEYCCSENFSHPNIVQFLGIYYPSQNSFPIIVMELMNVNLSAYLVNPNIDVSKKVSILHDVATGLNFLHARTPPVVHGCLSSDNILLKYTEEEMLPIAKIANLSMAKMVEGCAAISQNTESVVTVFTAPEILIDPNKSSTFSDVFSFGRVALHIFSQCPEIELHEIYLDMFTREVPTLKPLVEACLNDVPECRPSISVLLKNIKQLIMDNQMISKSINDGRERNINSLFHEAETIVHYHDSNKKKSCGDNKCKFGECCDDADSKINTRRGNKSWTRDGTCVSTTTSICDGNMQSDNPINDISTIKIVFVGDSCTGKTSLLQQYINSNFSIKKEHTMVNYRDATYMLDFWDAREMEKNKTVAKEYYQDIGGAFVVYDIPAKRISLQNCLQWKRKIDKMQLSIPVALIGNKVDTDKKFKKLDVVQFSKVHGFAGCFEASVTTGAGITEAIQFLVQKAHQQCCWNRDKTK